MSNTKIEKWFEIIDRELIKLNDAACNKSDYELYDFTQPVKWINDDIKIHSLQNQYACKVDKYICLLRKIYIDPYRTMTLDDALFDDNAKQYTLKHTLYYSDNMPQESKDTTYPYDDNIFGAIKFYNVSIDDIKKHYKNTLHKPQSDGYSCTWFRYKIPHGKCFHKGVQSDQFRAMRWFDVMIENEIKRLQLYNASSEYDNQNLMIDSYINDLREKYKSIDISKDVAIENKLVVEAKFTNIQSEIIKHIEQARVSILIAMAWFTDEVIKNVILNKKEQGLRIEIITYRDGVNKLHGVDLLELDHSKIRGTRGGTMHDKFCIIDNQIVITGSYNWSSNAENRNDENITIIRDNLASTDFSVEFRRLKPLV